MVSRRKQPDEHHEWPSPENRWAGHPLEDILNDDSMMAPVRFHTFEETYDIFDKVARREMNMSGDEFAAKWDAGEFGDPDNPYRPKLWRVAMLRPSDK